MGSSPRKPERRNAGAASPPAPKPSSASHRILATEADVAEGVAALVEVCEHMRRIHAARGVPGLRRHEAGFVGLGRTIIGQQLSTASANAIWRRVAEAVVPFDAATLLAASDDALKAAGLSAGKIATLRAVAQADLNFAALERLSDEEVRETLTAIRGIGPWTADIYLMFCLGRADSWAPGDLALAIGAQSALGLKARPSIDELTRIAERWRPWRAVAAAMLWLHYAAERRGRASQPPKPTGGKLKKIKVAAPKRLKASQR